jgi:hypothetical protein
VPDRDDIDDLLTALAEARQSLARSLDRLKPRSSDLAVRLTELWGAPPDLVRRTLAAKDGTQLELVYLDSRVDPTLVTEGLLKPLTAAASFRQWDAGGLPMGGVDTVASAEEASQALIAGRAVIGPGRGGRWYALDVAKPPKRNVEEPKVAQVTHGPHAGFIEDLKTNLGLLRHYLRTPLLRVESLKVGRQSPAEIVIARLVGVSRPGVAAAVRRRIRRAGLDGLVDASQLMGVLGAHAIVPTVQYSERPDQVAAALLEGRVAVLLDKSPSALLVPTTMAHLLSSPPDYYQPAVSATLVRLLRYAGASVTVLLPAVYVGVTTVNQPLIPLPLLLTFVRARLTIPFPIFLETLMMLLAFDLVYEAGLQVPSQFGQTVSVVGALVVGQAAVTAGIVSASTLIAVAFAYLAQLLIPDQNLSMVLRLLRYPALFVATIFGLIGVTATFAVLMAWGSSLRTYGVGYLSPLAPLRPERYQRDAILRLPFPRARVVRRYP